MKEFFKVLKHAYANRDRHDIDLLKTYFAEDIVTIGTSLGETGIGIPAAVDLIDSDLRYWVDVDWQDDYVVKQFEEYSIYEVKAYALYKFYNDAKRYKRYVGYMKNIGQESRSEYEKATKAIWMLDHVLSSKPKVRHYENRLLNISFIVKENKIKLIEFHFPMDKNHVDCYDGAESDMAEFDDDLKVLKNDEKINKLLKNTVKIDGLSFDSLTVERNKEMFYGIGRLLNHSLLDDEIAKDFQALEDDLTDYRKLYVFRKKITETLKLYSVGDTQKIMVRFFGLLDEQDNIKYLSHSYPFYWILDD